MNRFPHQSLRIISLLATLAIGSGAALAQGQQEIDWRLTATEWRGQPGKTFNVFCLPSTVRGGALWGTGVYTDDSSICMAAVHALVTFDHVRGGTVFFQVERAQEGYEGNRRRGVQSQSWAAFAGGLRIVGAVPGKRLREINDTTPMEITWSTSARHMRDQSGVDRIVLCPRGGTPQTVWGTTVYADDSSICAAAVHAGLITFENGGSATLRAEPGRENYKGSVKNGVTSLPWEKWEGSFSFSRKQIAVALLEPGVDPPPAPRNAGPNFVPVVSPTVFTRTPSGEYLITWATSAAEFPVRGDSTIAVYCPVAGNAARVWGSGDYTSDSSVCTAAVHALSAFDFASGGTAYIVMTPGLNAYNAESRKGVPSSPWGSFPASFRVVGAVPGKLPADITATDVTEISWNATLQQLIPRGLDRTLVCPPVGKTYPVWGTDVYSAQSSICGAAVHAGIVTLAAGGPVTIRIENTPRDLAGTTRNEIATQSVSGAGMTFSFRR